MSKGSYDYIEKLGTWRWRGYYRNLVDGKLKQKQLYAKSKIKLREKVEKWQSEIEAGEAGKDLHFKTWVDIWLDSVEPTIKIRTSEAYRYALEGHVVPRFGHTTLGRLHAQQFQQYFNELSHKYSSNTVATIRRYTVMCLEAAVRYGYIAINPARNTRPPRREKKEIVALDKEQTEAIILAAEEGKYQKNPHTDAGAEYLRQCYYTLIVTAVDTGLRQGELLGLQWSDINDGIITVRNNLVYASTGKKLDTPKTKTSARRVILTDRNKLVLGDWKKAQEEYANCFYGLFRNEGDMVFTNATGNYVDAHNFARRCWKPICSQIGLANITFHSLRHAHASQLLAAGISPQIVMQRLGHSSLDVTLRVYAHLLPSMQELEMNKINEVFRGGDNNGRKKDDRTVDYTK